MSNSPNPKTSKPGRTSRTKTTKGTTTKARTQTTKSKGERSASSAPSGRRRRVSESKPRLLSGGNPQIAKGDGDEPVRAYIAAMSGGGPGWKRDVGRRLDEIITRTLADPPGVRKAVRWNSPFYGVAGPEGERLGWFLSIHVLAKYVKVAFFRGAALTPMPPIESKMKDVRYYHIFEPAAKGGALFDEELVASWVRQAAKLPGADCF